MSEYVRVHMESKPTILLYPPQYNMERERERHIYAHGESSYIYIAAVRAGVAWLLYLPLSCVFHFYDALQCRSG